MCGIVGYVGKQKSLPILIEGLKRLEYRGYDSAGVATICDERLSINKQKGKISELEGLLKNVHHDGMIGIGHTRWATHGEDRKSVV